jgi:hypothetical protein
MFGFLLRYSFNENRVWEKFKVEVDRVIVILDRRRGRNREVCRVSSAIVPRSFAKNISQFFVSVLCTQPSTKS